MAQWDGVRAEGKTLPQASSESLGFQQTNDVDRIFFFFFSFSFLFFLVSDKRIFPAAYDILLSLPYHRLANFHV